MDFIIRVFIIRIFSFLLLILPTSISEYDKLYLLNSLCGALEEDKRD
jgi:hypothetical protein